MDHQNAIGTNAAERYLLDEMSNDERAAFEEHFFDCRVCAADITDETRLLVVGRVVANESTVPANVVPFRARVAWVPAAAAASLIFGLLGSGVGYRVAQHYGPATEPRRVVRIDTGESRAGTPVKAPVIVQAGDELSFDVVPHEQAEHYEAAVACSGKNRFKRRIGRELAADTVSIRPGELPAGRCELVIAGVRKDGKSLPITRIPFEVQER